MIFKEYNLLDICDVYQPHTLSKKEITNTGEYNVYGANGIIGSHNTYNHETPELVMGCRGSCGTLCITKPYSWINGNAMVIHPKDSSILQKYLYFCLLSANKKDIITGTSQPQITRTNLSKFTLPIPPIDEQQRIVDNIEELFSRLDKGVEELNKIKDQLKIYRQAVLKEAFDGKFISNCCNKEYKSLEYFIEKPRYGTSKKCFYELTNATPVYRIPNINISSNTINKDDLKYAQFDESEIAPLALQEGDILIIRSNGSVSLVGRAAIIQKKDISGLFAGYLMRLRIKDFSKLNPKFLIHFLNSHKARTYIEQTAKSTSGVNNINSNEISNLKIPIFSIAEQDIIVKEIESRLSICYKIEQTVNESLQKAESLRQSILKQAFEGKLI
jgi:type I restriction enzyme S subunit